MIPPRSPYGLLQEDLYPSEWLILVACIMLNCTTRKQVERVLPKFIRRWPTPERFLEADAATIEELVRCLGFCHRRTQALIEMTTAYVKHDWQHAEELPHVGVYASRCWEMLCRGIVGDEPPRDHALVKYWEWRRTILRSECNSTSIDDTINSSTETATNMHENA